MSIMLCEQVEMSLLDGEKDLASILFRERRLYISEGYRSAVHDRLRC